MERFKKYVALPTYCGIAGPLEDTPAKLADPLPVPWTSQFRPAGGAAVAVAAKAKLAARATRSASTGFT
jgi:hypothetical protein